MDSNIVLSAKGICMTFPGVKALQNVDFNLRKGEIRARHGGERRRKIHLNQVPYRGE